MCRGTDSASIEFKDRVIVALVKIVSTVFGALWSLLMSVTLGFYLVWKVTVLLLLAYGCRRTPIRFLWSLLYLVGVSPFMFAMNSPGWDDHPGRALMTFLLTLVVAEFSFRSLGRKGFRSTATGAAGAFLLIALF